MAEPLYELLVPYIDSDNASSRPSPTDPTTNTYLARLTTLSVASLTSTEPQSLSQSSASILRSLQSLSKRSHKAIIASDEHLSSLRDVLPQVQETGESVQSALPEVETAAAAFNKKYDRTTENEVLDRRRKALLLSSNLDRISTVLDLPSLLSTAISASNTSQAASAPAAPGSANYASALDLQAHIKRLHALYPDSPLVTNISTQAEAEMKAMTTNLLATLQSPNLKLAAAMRTVGWLRRVAPELASDESLPPISGARKPSIASTNDGGGGALGALFLVCRLANLRTTLSALDPLRDLADAETAARKNAKPTTGKSTWSGSQQTERFLKRWIEIFREQSFAVISMYKSIFPSALPVPEALPAKEESSSTGLPSFPPPLASFTMTLVDMLEAILRIYLPNVQERSARDSLLTQVLYCAGSLGRLGGDFGMVVALLEEELDDTDAEQTGSELEWVEVFKKHRVQASRLELLAQGVGVSTSSGRKFSGQAAAAAVG